MTNDKIALRTLLEKGSDMTFLREMIGLAAQRLMELESEARCGSCASLRCRSGSAGRDGCSPSAIACSTDSTTASNGNGKRLTRHFEAGHLNRRTPHTDIWSSHLRAARD